MDSSKTATRPLRLLVLFIILSALIWFVLTVSIEVNYVRATAPSLPGDPGMDVASRPEDLTRADVPAATHPAEESAPRAARSVAAVGRPDSAASEADLISDNAETQIPERTAAYAPEGAPTYTQVVADGANTCALTSAGAVRCWGINTFGQLGDGSTVTRSAPVAPAVDIGHVVALDASNRGVMAFTDDGKLWQWGMAGIFSGNATPAQYTGFRGKASEISLSSTHFCALIKGEPFCYGNNFQGALGDGTTNLPEAPVRVIGLDEPVEHISTGANYTCAVLQSGYIKCWGANWTGNLGNGKTEASLTPVFVRGLSGRAVDVEVNDWFACALLESGGVECWGGMQTNQTHAAPVDGLRVPADFLSVGRTSACAVSTGAVQCWGENAFGQLGLPASQAVWHAVDVALPGKAVDVAVGEEHGCATLDDGAIHCWGSDRRGQLGRGTQVERAVPVAVAQPLAATQVAVGGSNRSAESFTCAIYGTERGLRCWGASRSGALGLGEETRSAALPTVVPGLESGVAQVATGSAHACAITDDGATYCWGAGERGQLGTGRYDMASSPQRVTIPGAKAKQIIAGDAFTCVLLEAGSVRCWGEIVSATDDSAGCDASALPLLPEGLWFGVAHIYAGSRHACALMEMGDVRCWGQNQSGQVGNGETSQHLLAPVRIDLTESPVMLALGDTFSCALMPSHDVACWGDNRSGWMTRGDAPSMLLKPTIVGGLPTQLQSIAAGGGTFCTVSSEGGLACLGDNLYGNLGRGFAGRTSTRSASTAGMEAGVASVSVGETHTCAILDGGGLWCWGSDGDGELGVGIETFAQPASPVAAAPLSTMHINATTAAPGSILTASGFSFAPNQPIDLLVNGTQLTATAPLAANPAGALSLYIDTTGAQPGRYALTLATHEIESRAPVITGVTLILTTTAPLVAQQGRGLPIVTIGSASNLPDANVVLDPAPPAAAEQTIRLAIKPGANIRSTPNGSVLHKATAQTTLAYDAAAARAIKLPVEVTVDGAPGDIALMGTTEGNYSWVPVQMDGSTAWVGNVVILGAALE